MTVDVVAIIPFLITVLLSVTLMGRTRVVVRGMQRGMESVVTQLSTVLVLTV